MPEAEEAIEVDFGQGVGPVRFANHVAFRQAMNAERDAFLPLQGTPAGNPYERFWNNLNSLLNEYERVPPNDKPRVARQLALAWGEWVQRGEIFYSGSETGKFLSALAAEDRAAAMGAALLFAKGSVDSRDSRVLAGLVRAILFQLGIAETDNRAATVSFLQEQWSKAFKDIADKQDAAVGEQHEALKEFLKRSEVELNTHRQAAEKSVEAAVKNFEAAAARLTELEATYNNKLALQAPATYWETQASKHARHAGWFGGIFVASLVAGGGLLASLLYELLKEEHPPAWRIGTAITVGALVVWGIRVVAKLLFMNLHLAADARERETLIVTYLAMMKDSTALTKEERALMLGPLFTRSAAASGSADDLSPNLIQDLISKVKG